MKIYIKNMVCSRCTLLVMTELEKLGYHCMNVALGEAEIKENLTFEQLTQVNQSLQKFDLELISNKKDRLVEKVKSAIIEMVNSPEETPAKFSDYIKQRINYNYGYISNLFSENQGQTIEQYIIDLKINQVKDMILYDDLNLSEIANKMNYSSVAHLSNQFKKETGLSPTQFKQLKLMKHAS